MNAIWDSSQVTEGTELHLSSRSYHKGMLSLSMLVHTKGKPLDHERQPVLAPRTSPSSSVPHQVTS